MSYLSRVLLLSEVIVSMKTVALKPNFEIPLRMGLGLAALGRPGYINLGRSADLEGRDEAAMRRRAEEVLDAAYALGVRWFDAARSYGLAEVFLGDWLRRRGISRDEVCVTSKWGYTYVAEWRVDTGGKPHEIKDHSVRNLKKQATETVEALGDYVDLYQIHSATFDSGALDDEAVLAELAALKGNRGWKIGLSVSSPLQGQVVEAALTTRVDGEPLFDACQCTFNVLEQAPYEALVEASRNGVDVIVKEALANGRVFQCAPLLAAAQDLGVSPDSLALAAVLAQPFAPLVLSGAVTTAQLESNLKAHDLARGLDRAFLADLMDECRRDSTAYWAERSALAWN